MMDELILRVLTGVAEPLERRRLDHWRAESDDNELHFREVSAIWAASGPRRGDHRTSRPSTPPSPPTDELIRQGDALRRRPERDGRRGWTAGRSWIPWTVAAAFASVSLGLLVRGADRDAVSQAGTEYVAGRTEATTVSLSDGSFVRLDAGSRVRFAGDDDAREAWLTGRAFFGVTRDTDRAFVVHTDLGDTRVVGTRFEVREDAEGLRVVVVEGSVEVTTTAGGRAEVSKGQVATLAPNGDFALTTPESVYALLDWNEGLLLFQETPLGQVAEEVSARFGVRVEAEDALADRRVTAWFGDESLEEVTESLCLLVQARCMTDGDSVLITR